jgi:LDH2 family malate/lactate/ureidoglycolate dehydrogenase
MVDCMTTVNVSETRSIMLAKNLTEADVRGHFSHGLNRLAMYVDDLKSGLCDPNADPQVLKETPSTAWVDGSNTLGVVVGEFS